MLNVTQELRKHMADNFGIALDATDEVVRKAVGDAMVEGKLDLPTLTKLTETKATDAELRLKALVNDSVNASLSAQMAEIKTLILGGNGTNLDTAPIAPASGGTTKAAGASGGSATESGNASEDARKALMAGAGSGTSGDPVRIRIKAAVEQYDDTRSSLTWEKSSKPWLRKALGSKRLHTGVSSGGGGIPGRYLDQPTDRMKAIGGAWFKRMIGKAFGPGQCPPEFRLTEHDQALIDYAMHECKFVGPIGFSETTEEVGPNGHWMKGVKLSDMQRKALIDDSTSGGLEAVPIEFDDLAIITPLLEGELFPLVTVRNVTRRRIEGFSIGNPTMSWGTAEGTAHTVFDTAAFIAAFDTNVWPIMGAIEMGEDFLEDSPAAIGDIVLNRYGARFRQEMDNAIAAGSGSSRPTGVSNTSGITAVGSDNGTGGPPTVDDYESLLFGIPKELRQEAGRDRCVFIGTEASYQRVRGIPIGNSADVRRVFGMDEESYQLFEHPYKINESLDNSVVLCACLNRFRMYRRAGFGVRVETTGQTLALKNTRLLVVRARVGGQMELATAATKMADAQA